MTDADHEQLTELLSAYLDGELDDDRVLVEKTLRENEQARKLLEELRRTVRIVAALPRHDAPASIAEDIAARLERSELLGDLDESEPIVVPGARSPWSALFSMAAMIAVVAAGALWYTYDPGDDGPRDVVVLNDRRSDGEALSALRESATKSEKREAFVEMPSSKRASKNGVTNGAATVRERFSHTKADRFLTGAARKEASQTRSKDHRAGAGGQADEVQGVSRDRSVRRSLKLKKRGKADTSMAMNKTILGPPVPIDSEHHLDKARLLAKANLEQILAADGRVVHLRKHRFKNEALRLSIPAPDTAESEAFARRLVSALESLSIVDAATSKDDILLRGLSKKGFFLRGRAGVNYREDREEQIIVHVSVSNRDALLDEIGGWSGVANQVVLRSGPIRIRGLQRVRMDLSETVTSALAQELDADAHEASTRTDERLTAPTQSTEGDEWNDPGWGFKGLYELAQALTRAGEVPTRTEDSEIDAKSRTAGTTVEQDRIAGAPIHPGEIEATAAVQVVVGGSRSSSAPDHGDRTEAAFADADVRLEKKSTEQRKKDTAGGTRGETGSLVQARLKELESPRTRSLRAAGKQRQRGKSAIDRITFFDDWARPASWRKNEAEREPEAFVTLVFQFVPHKTGKAKASARTGAKSTTKPKSPTRRRTNQGKGNKKNGPAQQ